MKRAASSATLPPRVRSALPSGTVTTELAASAVLVSVLHPLLDASLRCVELCPLLGGQNIPHLGLFLLADRLNPCLHIGAKAAVCRSCSGRITLLAKCPGRIDLSALVANVKSLPAASADGLCCMRNLSRCPSESRLTTMEEVITHGS